jgi:RNA polymerase sigma-70 factor (ECF subfamily)
MVVVRRNRPPTPIEEPEIAGLPFDEGDLIALARRDPQAFAPLYTAYFDPVYRYCLRCLGEREAAADAAQEVFARALRALPRYRDDAFRPWLFTIAHNVIVDGYRQRDRRPPDAPLKEAEWHADPAPGPEHAALAAEAGRTVHECLTRLTPDQRAVVELRLADLTGQEIADVLSRSLGSVKIAQHRAFRRLAVLMGADANGKEDRDGEH